MVRPHLPNAETSHPDAKRLNQAVAVGIFILGIIVTYLLATSSLERFTEERRARLEQQTAAMSNHLQLEAFQYEQMLRGTAAFVDLNEKEMDRQRWKAFIDKRNAVEEFPSVLGFGYVDLVEKGNIDEYNQRLSQEYDRPVSINPTNTRDTYTAIAYLEPENELNRLAVGYDMFSEETRREAMERARDNGEVALSGLVRLVQDRDSPDRYGALLFFPLYAQNTPIESVDERRENLIGYIYLVLRPSDIASTISPEAVDPAAVFTVTDIESNKEVTSGADMIIDESTATSSRTIELYGRTWQVQTWLTGERWTRQSGVVLTLMFGFAASGLLAIVVYGALTRRINRIRDSYDKTVADTKNELIMLTSHQLRTPASGVKQYLGMLREGMFGELDPVHGGLIEKAYNANERQIETIDQILHVAKADAGQMLLELSEFDMRELIETQIDMQSDKARAKSITIETKLPRGKKPVAITADRRYVGMVVENLLSNAIKYSHPDSTVTLTLKVHDKSLSLTVADEGVGISEEDMPRMFEKFVRIDNPLSIQEGGTGLGLFLAERIATSHRGDITVKANGERGTLFTLTLPLKQPTRRRSVSVNPK